jgi:hypothetical protein
MDLSGGSSGLNASSGDSFSGDGKKETVRLLSYANNGQSGGGQQSGGRFYQQQSKKYSSSSLHAHQPVKKSAEKFFRTLRRRSKSATRLGRSEERGDQFRSETDVEEDDGEEEAAGSDITTGYNGITTGDNVITSENNIITYRVNGDKFTRNNADTGSRKKEKVQLVGFSQIDTSTQQPLLSKRLSPSAGDLLLLECASARSSSSSSSGGGLGGGHRSRKLRGGGARRNLDFGGSVSNLCFESSSNKPNVGTLKTSREVKMERERLRMEKMMAKEKSRMQQQQQQQLLQQDSPSSRPTLFDDRLHPLSSASSSDNDVFSQFVRENQERFAQLVQQHRAAATTLSERVRLQQQQQLCNAFSSTGNGSSAPSLRTGALQLPLTPQPQPASGSNNSEPPSQPKVHHIHIQRESLNCELAGDGQVDVRSESNAKLQIVVNEDAVDNTVVAERATSTVTQPKNKDMNS